MGLNSLVTHRVCWSTELPKDFWRIGNMDLQGHARSGTKFIHHILQHKQSRVNDSPGLPAVPVPMKELII